MTRGKSTWPGHSVLTQRHSEEGTRAIIWSQLADKVHTLMSGFQSTARIF